MVELSAKIQRDKGAVRVLRAIVDLCTSFCEVPKPAVKEGMKEFTILTLAVIVSPNIVLDTEIGCSSFLSDTKYEVDRLLESATQALSVILDRYPEHFSTAALLFERCSFQLLDLVHSAPTVSMRRRIIWILRVLYDHVSNKTSFEMVKMRIEEIVVGFIPGRDGLSLLRSCKISDDTGYHMLAKALVNVDPFSQCISCSCSVEVTGRSVEGYVDFNQRSVVVHFAGQSPWEFPLYLIETMNVSSCFKQVGVVVRSFLEPSQHNVVLKITPSDSKLMAAILGQIRRMSVLCPFNLLASEGNKDKDQGNTVTITISCDSQKFPEIQQSRKRARDQGTCLIKENVCLKKRTIQNVRTAKDLGPRPKLG